MEADEPLLSLASISSNVDTVSSKVGKDLLASAPVYSMQHIQCNGPDIFGNFAGFSDIFAGLVYMFRDCNVAYWLPHKHVHAIDQQIDIGQRVFWFCSN